jgi:hypothetical protein
VHTFEAKSQVPKLAFNFTGFQRNDGAGNCVGSGVIAEPDTDRLCAWYAAARSLRSAPFGPTAAQTPAEEKLERTRASAIGAISELGGGVPSVAQLEGLPYRVLVDFFRWLEDKLAPLEAVGF